jgi:hypothetical protein
MLMEDFNDLIKDEKISLEQVKSFADEITKEFKSQIGHFKLENENLKKQLQQLANYNASLKQFIKERLADQESQLREIEHQTGAKIERRVRKFY